MKKLWLLALALFFGAQTLVMASDAKKILSFYQNGKLVKKLNQEDLKSLVGEVQLKTIEPHDKSAVTYIGVPFNKVLSAVYGDGWTNTKKIKFTCLDGYNPPIDHNMFFKHEAFLVYAKAGTKDFTLKKDNETGKIVELGPYYLTWDALKATVLNNTNNRPYQLTAIDVQL